MHEPHFFETPQAIARWIAVLTKQNNVTVSLRCSEETGHDVFCIAQPREHLAHMIFAALSAEPLGNPSVSISLSVSHHFHCKGRSNGKQLLRSCECQPTFRGFARRLHERVAAYAKARIGAHSRWQDCTVLNISIGGARLKLAEPSRTSLRTLDIAGFGQFRTALSWQHGHDVGVKFEHDPAELAGVVSILQRRDGQFQGKRD